MRSQIVKLPSYNIKANLLTITAPTRFDALGLSLVFLNFWKTMSKIFSSSGQMSHNGRSGHTSPNKFSSHLSLTAAVVQSETKFSISLPAAASKHEIFDREMIQKFDNFWSKNSSLPLPSWPLLTHFYLKC